MDVKIGKPYGECGFPVFVFCLFIQEHNSFLIISLSVQIRQAAALQVGSVLLPVGHIPALPQGGCPVILFFIVEQISKVIFCHRCRVQHLNGRPQNTNLFGFVRKTIITGGSFRIFRALAVSIPQAPSRYRQQRLLRCGSRNQRPFHPAVRLQSQAKVEIIFSGIGIGIFPGLFVYGSLEVGNVLMNVALR